jgi:hypothetical protein
MIVIRIIGGLGNQMFQYAMVRSMSIEKKQNFKLDISGFDTYKLHNYSLQHFNIEANYYKKANRFLEKILNLFYKETKFTETDFGFDENFVHLTGDTIYLEGYFQSEKYFNKHASAIRNDFKVKSKLKPKTIETISYMKTVNAVSIHIRRGDYLTNEKHNTDKEDSYTSAIAIIVSKINNPVFFVFSDDIEWVKSNITTKFETNFIDFNDVITNFEDLILMSNCQHNIITNSSFSWWGAWLNENENKIVIAPQKWFTDDTNSNDIIPDTWLKV